MFGKHSQPKDCLISENGFIANQPEGMAESLKWAYRYKLPVYITENGVEDSRDSMRPDYLVQHLHQVWKYSNYAAPVKGYFHWSLVDNFEWERGWTQRFGLWGLNTETQVRQRRPSVDLYAAICKSNSISAALVEKFAPASFEKLFQG
jgi:beta-glucosidase